MSMYLTPQEMAVHERFVYDHEFFARHLHRIEPKDLAEIDPVQFKLIRTLSDDDEATLAGTVPYIMHPGQLKLHGAAEDMMRRKGYVRKAMVKPRQVGWSTQIQSRAHWRVTNTPGMKVVIVSHSTDSTSDFLRRAKVFCKSVPDIITPGRQVDNSKKLVFTNGASYDIATAGSPQAMRSRNSHFLHISEEAYFEFAQAVLGSVIPGLSKGRGSEGYRESTSNGRGTPWHLFIQEVQAEQNEWEIFFDPWFNHPKYRTEPPIGWEPDQEALEAAEMFKLDRAQLYWRAMMIKDLRAMWLFRQEFPATIEESFQASADTLYNADVVAKARTTQITLDEHAPLIMGVDPARTGDRTVIAFRQGNVVREVIKWPKMDDMRLVGIIAGYLNDGYKGKRVSKCFIDYAIGEGAASRLRELNFRDRVTTVHFGETPFEDRYANKRIEMAIALRDWFGDRGDMVSIPNDDDVASDLMAIPDFVQVSGSEKLKLPPKEKIKKDYGKSPDIFDAIILTFAYPVAAERVAELQAFTRNNLSHLNTTELSSILSDFEGR